MMEDYVWLLGLKCMSLPMSESDKKRLDSISARLEQLERENAELKAKLAQCTSWNTELDIRLKAATHPALGPNPTVAEIVRDYLKRNGCQGLYSEHGVECDSTCECHCFDGDLFRYEADDGELCRAGYIQPDGSVGPEKEGE